MSQSPGQPVLILSGVRGDTRRYRTLHLYEQLRLAGVNCIITHLTDPHLKNLAKTASAVIVHRVAYDGYVAKLLADLRKRNTLIVLDADDFLYDPAVMRWIDSPDFQDPVRAALYRRELLRHRETLAHCDAITVSTGYLAALMGPFGKPVSVHRNAFNLEMLTLSNQAIQARTRPADRVVIGYASGTRTHDHDFALIQPALHAVLEKYPQVELWLMGPIDPGPNWGTLIGRIKTFPLIPWRELPARLAMLDINLAPLLPESPFNQAKSEIKYVEAALVKVPTIASRTDAFAYAIKTGKNGFLADCREDWQSMLEMLVENGQMRQAVGEAAYQDALANYAPWLRGQAVAQLLAGWSIEMGKVKIDVPAQGPAPVAHDPVRQQPYFSAADEAHPTMLEMARYSLAHRGITTLLGQIWVYFRRLLAPIFPFKR